MSLHSLEGECVATLFSACSEFLFGHFWASWGVPPGSIFQYFSSKFHVFSIAFDLNITFTPRILCTKNCLATTWNLSFSTSQLCSMDCPFELIFASATCKTAHCRGGLGEATLNPPRHKSLVYATAGVSRPLPVFRQTLSSNTCKHVFKSHCHDDYWEESQL